MVKNKRTRMTPIPDDLEKILSPLQLMTLRTAENEGWELYFVRRDGLEVPIPFIKGADSKTIGIIDKDGKFNAETEIRIRISPDAQETT